MYRKFREAARVVFEMRVDGQADRQIEDYRETLNAILRTTPGGRSNN